MAPPVRKMSRNGQRILPVIYVQPQSKTQRLLPFFIVGTCGVWIFAMGALLERLPDGRGLPVLSTFDSSLSSTTPTSSYSSLSSSGNQGGDNNHFNDGIFDPATVAGEEIMNPSPKSDTNGQDRIVQDASRKRKDSASLLDEKHQQKEARARQHSHDIPNVLIFTHKINLLEYKPTLSTTLVTEKGSNTTASKDNVSEQEELMALQQNIQHSILLHPGAQVRFLTDEDCIRSLQAMLGPNAPLIKYFQQESAGMYKADICRGAALWETGGIYLDADIGVRMPLFEALQTNTTFATSLVHKDSNHLGNFFQAFMAATSGHAILERYLHLFLQHYQGTLTRPIKKGPLGVILLRQAFDDVVLGDSSAHSSSSTTTTTASKIDKIDLKSAQNITDKDKHFRLGPKLVDTTNLGRIQIWQEILYNPKYMSNVPAPTWGTRRACRFVVVANRQFPLIVPMYSRIEGSRICPPNNNNNKSDSDSDAKAGTKQDHSGNDTILKSNNVASEA